VSALSVGESRTGRCAMDGGSKTDQSLIDKNIPTRRMLIKPPIFQQHRPIADKGQIEIPQCTSSMEVSVLRFRTKQRERTP
jgi:hypothetical protein